MWPTTSWKRQRENQGGASAKLGWHRLPGWLTRLGILSTSASTSWQAQIYQTVGRTFQASQLAAAIQLEVRTGDEGISISPASSNPHTSLLASLSGWTLQAHLIERQLRDLFFPFYLISWKWDVVLAISVRELKNPRETDLVGPKIWPCLLGQLTWALSV